MEGGVTLFCWFFLVPLALLGIVFLFGLFIAGIIWAAERWG